MQFYILNACELEKFIELRRIDGALNYKLEDDRNKTKLKTI